MKKITQIVFCSILLLGISHLAVSQTLITDTNFGSNGTLHAMEVGVTTATKILMQLDKKIIIGGYNYDFSCNCFYNNMIRINPCGTIDSSFGVNGEVHHTFDQRNIGKDYILQDDGKILVSGLQSDGNAGSQQFPFVARYNADGSVDSTFGNNGTNKITYVGAQNFSNVYLLNSGKILCTGGNGSNLIMRLNFDGSVDPTFGNNGAIQNPVPPGVVFFYDFTSVRRSNGKIISAAPAWLGNGNDKNVVLSCFDTLGVIDSTYGTNGFFIDYNFVIGGSELRQVIQSDDKVIIAYQNPQETEIKIARYNTNGSLDNTYGNNGYVVIPAPNNPSRLQSVTVLNNDQLLISYQSNGVLPVFKKFDANGVELTDFSLNGSNTFQFSNFTDDDHVRLSLVSPDGELFLAGSTFRFSATRFILSSPIPNISISGSTLNANIQSTTATFQWYLNGNPIANATNNTITATQNGTYMVEVTTYWGCTYSDDIQVTSVRVEESISSAMLTIYPNPVEAILNINTSDNREKLFQVFDTTGKLLITETSTTKQVSIEVSELPSGMYIVQIKSENEILQKKFVKN